MKRKKDNNIELECEETISCYNCDKYSDCTYNKRKSLDCPLYLCIKTGKRYKDCSNCDYI